MSAARFRRLILEVVEDVWPTFPGGAKEGAAWIEAQVQAESQGRPDARSGVGAVGLLQLMPGTADEMGVADPTDPEQNLRGGVRYLRLQHEHFDEIPQEPDRLFWSFGAYNAGRGYMNRALAIARQDGERFWWLWGTGSHWLAHRDCVIRARAANGDVEHRPDYRQVWAYVRAIRQFKAHPAEIDAA